MSSERPLTDTVDVVPDGDGYHVYQQEETLPTSSMVVTSLAAVEGTDPTEISTLASVVDPDALDRLFGSAGDGVQTAQFEFGGYEVTVHSATHVSVY